MLQSNFTRTVLWTLPNGHRRLECRVQFLPHGVELHVFRAVNLNLLPMQIPVEPLNFMWETLGRTEAPGTELPVSPVSREAKQDLPVPSAPQATQES